MGVTLIIGSQWGDEGKGKVIDFLSTSADIVIRFQGGNNAGHTVINPYGTFKMHLLPSGIFQKNTKVCISNGTVLDLQVLIDEIEMVRESGIDLTDRLFISPRCHIILPYHKLLDRLFEEAKGDKKIGTTGSGIGPVYADKVSYNGIRLSDFLDKKRFYEKLTSQLSIKNKVLTSFGAKPLSIQTVEKQLSPLRESIKSFIIEPYPLIQKALKQNKNILLEGAQAVFLDNDWGTYPYVTASTVVSGGVTSGAGVAPTKLTDIIGVVKAYTTRVGEGPFPTELTNRTGEKIQKIGHEFGATTGRPRRCGWLDLEMVRFAASLNGITSFALTKLDVLDDFDEIKICTHYTLNGKKVSYFDGDDVFLSKITPVYKIMKGWRSNTKGITSYDDLPPNAKKYIKEIEKNINVPIALISTGPSREEIIKVL